MKKLFFLMCFFQAFYIFPCSIFSYKTGGKILFCANEDWIVADPSIMTIESSKNSYGVVLLGWNNYLPNYPQTGINSEGLCFDWAAVPAQTYRTISGKKVLDINSTIEMLQKCKNIEEAIEYISNSNFSHIAEEHLMLCDKNNSCVIEYTKDEYKIIRSRGISQYITNFNLTDKEAGWYPCTRYSIMESKLGQTGLKEIDLIQLLDDIHQENEYSTQYSYIINVTDLTIKIFVKHQYNQSKTYNVNDLLVKDQKVRM